VLMNAGRYDDCVLKKDLTEDVCGSFQNGAYSIILVPQVVFLVK
jgi:hypothetical protein